MKKINAALAVILLAALIFPGLNGQQEQVEAQTEKPPIKSECRVVSNVFVKGQNIEIGCILMFRVGTNFNADELKNITNKDFTVTELFITDPAPVPDDKDYNFVMITQVLRPTAELKYGRYRIGLSLNFRYPEVAWQGEGDKKALVTTVISKVERFAPIEVEKTTIFAMVNNGDGFHDVVNIGEHVNYALHIFYETGAVTLLNDLASSELDKKYGVTDATKLDNPDLKPFVVINKDDANKKIALDRGLHKELIYNYRLALYDVSQTMLFEIPQLNIYYIEQGKNEVAKLITTPIKIRTNSVLNEDSDFRPPKNILKSDIETFLRFGVWPIRVAYTTLALAGLIILYVLLMFFVRHIGKIYKAGLRESLAQLNKSVTARIYRLTYVARILAGKAFKRFEAEPTQYNLKLFINQLRLYMGARAKIPKNLALSFAVEEFAKIGISSDALAAAESFLDEKITPEDTATLKLALKNLIATEGFKNKPEEGTWS